MAEDDKLTCLRCGKPYDEKPGESTSNGPVYDFDGHVCNFGEEDNPFETGVVGRSIVNEKELSDFIRDYEHVYAGAYNHKGNKRLTVKFNQVYTVYSGSKEVCRTTDLSHAVASYNQIVLN